MLYLARAAAGCAACLFLFGCASTQLDFNTLDLASTIDDLVNGQVVYNLGKFAADPHSNPTQVAISSGSVSTTNQASLSWANPLNSAITTTATTMTAAGAVLPAITKTTTGVAGSATLTPSGTNQASQNWSITADTDSDQERRLRALYRFATHTDYQSLCSEYPLIVTQGALPTTNVQSDTGAWNAAATANTADAYRAYLRSYPYPYGFHVDAARELIRVLTQPDPKAFPNENLAWEKSLARDDPSAYSDYLKGTYTDGYHYKNKALELLGIAIQVAGAKASQPASPGQSVTVVSTPSGGMTVTTMDAQFLREPGCVICSRKANAGNINVDRAGKRYYCPAPGVAASDLYINSRLKNDWLRVWPADASGPEVSEATYIGRYSDLKLYTTNPEHYRQFVLFVLEATNQGSAAGQSGKTGPSGQKASITGASFAQPTFIPGIN